MTICIRESRTKSRSSRRPIINILTPTELREKLDIFDSEGIDYLLELIQSRLQDEWTGEAHDCVTIDLADAEVVTHERMIQAVARHLDMHGWKLTRQPSEQSDAVITVQEKTQ